MKDFNKINSAEEEPNKDTSTGWEDVADFAPENRKSIDEIRDKFNGVDENMSDSEREYQTKLGSVINVNNMDLSMNKGETSSDRLATYRKEATLLYDGNYKAYAERYQENVQTYDESIKKVSDRLKDLLSRDASEDQIKTAEEQLNALKSAQRTMMEKVEELQTMAQTHNEDLSKGMKDAYRTDYNKGADFPEWATQIGKSIARHQRKMDKQK